MKLKPPLIGNLFEATKATLSFVTSLKIVLLGTGIDVCTTNCTALSKFRPVKELEEQQQQCK